MFKFLKINKKINVKKKNKKIEKQTFFSKKSLSYTFDFDELYDDCNLIIKYDTINKTRFYQNMYEIWINKNIGTSSSINKEKLNNANVCEIDNKKVIFDNCKSQNNFKRKTYGNQKWLESRNLIN